MDSSSGSGSEWAERVIDDLVTSITLSNEDIRLIDFEFGAATSIDAVAASTHLETYSLLG